VSGAEPDPLAGLAGMGTISESEVVSVEGDPAARIGRPDRGTVRRERRRLLLRSPTFLVGSGLVLFWVICAIVPGVIAHQSPFQNQLLERLKSPSSAHWFGTDELGRDVFSRVIHGARDILIVAPLATAIGTIGGTAIGLVTGYYRGLIDETIMRVVDAFLAIPFVIMGLLALVALGPSTITVILVIGVVFTPIIARTVRAAVLGEREMEYVQAATLRHERSTYIMFAEILPNVMGPILVEFTVRVGYAIFAIATLSFLGFGIQPPAPDWGLLIASSYGYMAAHIWWPTVFPALAIATLVVGINLVSDGLTQVFER
jgi:peptide/nickel transport system permease protein